MTGTIYLVQKDDTLIKMNQMAYQQEEDFQNLLVKFPELLSGEQINSTEPRRWLLIGREVPVPSEAEGDARWFLDHLFLDQDAIPTLVEVKRKSDTRLRREVVGQMLDYVANAVVYWDEKKIYELFEATCKASDCKPEEILFKKLGIEKEQAIFWQNAGLNLKQGKVRLVFVADMIPPELQRIIEFLNERMTPTEVLGVEIRQYTGGGFSTHIPRVIGQTSEAQVTKSRPSGARRTWNEEAFFNDIQKRVERDELNHDYETVVRRLYNFSKNKKAKIVWGTGTVRGSFNPYFGNIRNRAPYTVWSDGTLYIRLDTDTPLLSQFSQIYYDELEKYSEIKVGLTGGEFPVKEWARWIDQFEAATEATLQRYEKVSQE